MIVVRVELWSAITGQKTDLGSVVIDNLGSGSRTRGDYRVRQVKKGGDLMDMVRGAANPVRQSHVMGHPRLSNPVLNLVFKALKALGHDK